MPPKHHIMKEIKKWSGPNCYCKGSCRAKCLLPLSIHFTITYSFAIEVARYRDPVKYSMLTELDRTPITEHFAVKVSH